MVSTTDTAGATILNCAIIDIFWSPAGRGNAIGIMNFGKEPRHPGHWLVSNSRENLRSRGIGDSHRCILWNHPDVPSSQRSSCLCGETKCEGEWEGPMWAALALWQSLKHVFLHSESSPLSQKSWSCPFRGRSISSPLKLDFKNHFDEFSAGWFHLFEDFEVRVPMLPTDVKDRPKERYIVYWNNIATYW